MKRGGSRQSTTADQKPSHRSSSSSSTASRAGGEARPAVSREAGGGGGLKRKEAPTTVAVEARATKSKREDVRTGTGPVGKEEAAAEGLSEDTVVVEMKRHGDFLGKFPYHYKFMEKCRGAYDAHLEERTDRSPFVLKHRDDYIDFGNGDVSGDGGDGEYSD